MEDPSKAHVEKRRARNRARATVNAVAAALNESMRLAAAGQFAAAERAARLSERHAKLAAQLMDLKAALGRIAHARYEAERRVNDHFAEREADLAAREAALKASLKAPAHPPLDPWNRARGGN